MKRQIRYVAAFVICIMLSFGIVYGVYLFHVKDPKLNYVSNINAKFEDSEYYESILNEQLQRWIVNQNLCDDADETITGYSVGKTDILVKMILRYQSIGKEEEKKILTNSNSKKSISQQVKGKKIFQIVLNRNVKLKADGSIVGDYEYNNLDYNEEKSVPSDYYALYSEGGFYVALPESFYINKAQQTRIQKATIIVGLPKNKFLSYEKIYNNYILSRKGFAKKFSGLVMAEFIGILLLICLFTSEKTMPDIIRRTIRVWYEAVFAISVGLFAFGILGCVYAVNTVCEVDESEGMLVYTVTGLGAFICILALALCLQDLVWRMKKGVLLESTFVARITKYFVLSKKQRKELELQGMEFQEKQMRQRKESFNLIRKCLFISVVGGVIVAVSSFDENYPLWTIFGIAILGLIMNHYLNQQYRMEIHDALEAEKLVEQIDKIAEGNFDFESGVSNDSVYKSASGQLSRIGNGLEEALEKQMQDERMKIDLITNVSHDLKTPLTSIVGYTDLLLKDETLSPQARDYVMILSNKTARLQQLILDLFELAKASSGDVKVDFAMMNLRKLVEQVIVELSNRIEESKCRIVFEDYSKHSLFLGDVNRMYRVVQNILENALKYSLEGTRIFINIRNIDKEIVLEVKNTASYEMNFTKEEIMERFARGDKARSNDGTGLGLSIADSFTKNCNGKMDVEIDGDQFKVIIRFLALMDDTDMV
ncbi:MAG: HAMP domain-containing sensor histidine kinase [Anaerostipes sp.]|nr:HAMP domain-containing sensor histidine kinase [Anaerostipes sp.]